MNIEKDFFSKNNLKLISLDEVNIELDPSITIGYDFTVEDFYTFETSDGIFIQDTMGVFHPLSDEAQDELRNKMLPANETVSAAGDFSFALSKEMWVGLYTMTKEFNPKNSPLAVSDDDLKNANNPYIGVKFKNKNTTMGKAIFNSCFPRDFEFVDEQATKKIVGKTLQKIYTRYGSNIAKECVNRLSKAGFKFATIIASSIKIKDLELPRKIYELKEKLGKGSTDDDVKLIAEMKKLLYEHLKGTGLYDLVESGSTKGWDQPTQILITKGIIADPSGKVLPTIKGSFTDGLSEEEYFNASSGARKGIIDRVINTADTGYMSRKLAYVLNSVEADLYLKDCGTRRTLNIKLDSDTRGRLTGRYVIRNGKLQLFNENDYKIGSTVNLRSPIFCKSPKICHTCYGELLRIHKSPYVGVIAAQSIGERGTQLIMRTFHTGGAVKFIEKDILKDILDNDPLADLER